MFTYDRVPRSLIRNGHIPPSIKNTFVALRSHCNIHTRKGEVYIRELAAETCRKNRTICRHLAWLIANGFIHRQLRKKKGNPKENYKSTFTILRWDLPEDTKKTVGTDKNYRDKDSEIEYLENNTKETNIREAETSPVVLPMLETTTQQQVNPEAPKVSETAPSETDCGKPEVQTPKQKTISKAETVEKPETAPEGYDLSGLPEILHPTAIFYLSQTERKELTEKDKQILRELLENHYPARIQGEILYRLKMFKELGRTKKQLTLNYIYAILKNQRSIVDEEPEVPAEPQAEPAPQAVTDPKTEAIYERVVSTRRQSNKKAAKRTPKVERKEQSIPAPVELAMPVAEAEKVIADYEAEQVKEPEPAPAIPAALEELFTKIQDKQLERTDEYFETLPKDEDGCYVLPETLDENAGSLTIEDYLSLKYPEAEEEELHRAYSGQVYESVNEHPEASRLQAAFEIDYACATCMNPDNCQLPEGFKKGQSKPEAKMFTSKDGKRCLGTGFEGCIKCKHDVPKPAEKTPEEKRQEAEFERMMSKSGIVRREKTFGSYHPEMFELIVAKAKAILAAKTGRNLVLAGRAGTGKTHLATAIAIEAMKAGRQAIIKLACEMLDEITQANRDNTDPFGVLQKYKSVPVLVIDDWDKMKMTDARLVYLHQILDYRYTNGLQTIVTTNAYDMAGLESRWYPGRIEPMMSRLLENGDWVTIREAENYRLKPADDEMEAAALAELAEMNAELENPEYKLAKEAQAEIDAEYCALNEPEVASDTRHVVAPKSKHKTKLPHCEALLGVGCVIHVPSYDDGLDDDEDDLTLYGDTGIPSHDDDGDTFAGFDLSVHEFPKSCL